MAPNPLDSLRAASEDQSIFTPVPTVPQTTTVQPAWNSPEGRLLDLWPKRGDVLPEALSKIWKAQEVFDWKQIWALEFNNKLLASMDAVSCLYFGGIFRKAVKLTGGGAGAINVLMPSIVGSTIFDLVGHAHQVLVPMSLTPGSDHTKEIIKSTSIHFITSCFYPFIFTSASAIYFASRLNTFPVPEDLIKSQASRRYLLDKVIRPTIRRNKKGLVAAILLNTVGMAVLTAMEGEQLKMVYGNLVTTLRNEKKIQEDGKPLRQVVIGKGGTAVL